MSRLTASEESAAKAAAARARKREGVDPRLLAFADREGLTITSGRGGM